MTGTSIPNWALQHYQQSRQRFISLYTGFARQNKDNYVALQEEIHNLLMALSLAAEMQSESAVDMVNDCGAFFLQQGYWLQGLDLADQVVSIAQQLCNKHPEEEKHTYAWASIQVMRVGFLLIQGNIGEAGTTLQRLVEAENFMNHQQIPNGLMALTAALSEMHGESEKALALYQTTLEQLETTGYLPLVSYLLYAMAELLTEQHKYEEAMALYKQKLEIDRQTRDVSSIIETLQGLGKLARSSGLTELAEESYLKALELAQSISSLDMQLDILKKLANSAYEREDYATAAQLHEQALAIARKEGNKWAVASTLTYLALAREELGEDVTGLLKESLTICQDLNDNDGMIMAMIQLGDAYLTQQDTARAKEQYSQAATLATHIINYPLTALAWLQMGNLASAQEDWEEAEQCYEQGLSAHRHFDDPFSRALVQRGLGQATFMRDKLEAAKRIIETNIELYAQLGDWESHAECLYELACVYAQENNTSKSQQLAQRSSDIFAELGSPKAIVVDEELAALRKIENGIGEFPSKTSS